MSPVRLIYISVNRRILSLRKKKGGKRGGKTKTNRGVSTAIHRGPWEKIDYIGNAEKKKAKRRNKTLGRRRAVFDTSRNTIRERPLAVLEGGGKKKEERKEKRRQPTLLQGPPVLLTFGYWEERGGGG